MPEPKMNSAPKVNKKNDEPKVKKSSLLKNIAIGTALGVGTIIGSADGKETGKQKESVKIENSTAHQKIVTENKDNNFFKSLPENFKVDAEDRFFAKDKEGNEYFNWWSLISPIQVSVEHSEKQSGNAMIKLPYRYSRAFNSAEATNTEHKKEVQKYIQEKMKEELAEKIIFFGIGKTTENVYREHHLDEKIDSEKLKINEIKITGLASAEGQESKGKNTLGIGNIDKENLSLAGKRGNDMKPEVIEALKMFGISDSVISKMDSTEVQFLEKELKTMDGLAKKIGINDTVDELESAFQLTLKYNAGEIKDTSVVKELDKIFESKRGVEVEISYEGDKKTKHVIPIPLFLLLELGTAEFIRRWLKRKKEERYSSEKIKEKHAPFRERFERTTTSNEKLLEEKNLENKINADHPIFKDLYEKAKNSNEIKENRKRISDLLLTDEFNPYLGTFKDYVGYLDIVEYLSDGISWKAAKGHRDNQEKENIKRRAAFNIINQWELSDVNVRAQEGIATKNELHYWQEPKKIIWAQVAVDDLLRYADIYEEERKKFHLTKPHSEDAVYKAIAQDVKNLRKETKNDPIQERKNIRKVDKLISYFDLRRRMEQGPKHKRRKK